MQQTKIRFLADTLGLSPLPVRLKQAAIVFKGEEDVPRSRFGLSSISQLHLRVSLPLWCGKPFVNGRVIISNLFNHTQTPVEEGWSVKRSQVKDYRGKKLTYNSHNGTDFAVPVGTTVCTAAPGKVVAILSEFNRGGLKVFVDHGQGLITCYAHLAKSLVKVHDVLHRAQPIGISGYSGIDGAVTFPFGVPHVHFNVWLNGEPVDPFPHDGKPSMWRNGELPMPAAPGAEDFVPTVFNENAVQAAIRACKTERVRKALAEIEDIEQRAVRTIIEMNYYPTRFTKRINVYGNTFSRQPVLDLPFSGKDFKGVIFLDEILRRLNR
jgi:murein DD-endopeptidase